MKRKIISLMLAVMTVCTLFSFTTYAKETDDGSNAKVIYYVAKNGNDSNPGTIDEPFATIDKARDAIRDLKQTSGLPDGGVTVYVREGVYERETSLEFTQEDSGEEDKRITYSAYPGEKVEITGGKYINGGDFKKVTDQKLLDRLYPEVRDKLVYVNLKDYGFNGVTDYGAWDLTENHDGHAVTKQTFEPWSCAGPNYRGALPGLMVFMDDVALDVARVPNRISKGENKGMWDYFESGKLVSSTTGDKGQTFVYTDDKIERWENLDDVTVYGFWSTSWSFINSSIASVDKEKKQITLENRPGSTTTTGRRYLYLNVFDELDTESEYYIDKNTMNLYMLKSDALKNARIGVTRFGRDSSKDFLVYFNGASNITLRGFDITLSRSTGVYIKHGYNNLVDQCEIKNHGHIGYAVHANAYGTRRYARGMMKVYSTEYMNHNFEAISREEYLEKWETKNNGLTNSVVKNTGSWAVMLTGGDMIEVEPANNYVYNCDISYGALYQTALISCVDITGIGNTISHCNIHDTSAAAVFWAGFDLVVEYSDIYRTALDVSDYGIFYSCGWLNEADLGCEIRYNYIHDTPNTNYPGDHMVAENGISQRHAIYNDNHQPYTNTHHNIIYNVPSGIFNGSGPENNVNDNVFIDVLAPFWIFGNSGVSGSLNSGKGPFYTVGYTIFEDPDFTQNEKFLEKYPEYTKVQQEMLERGEGATQPASDMSDNVSIFYNIPERTTKQIFIPRSYFPNISGEYCRTENNFVTTEDIGFVDIDNCNFNFKENAKIFETHPGLKDIDFDAIGYKKDRAMEIADNNVMLKVNESTAYKFGDIALVDSENANVAPIIKDSRTLVPVRFIAEALDSKVDWDADTKTVTITKGGKTVTLKIGDDKMNVDGETVTLDVSAQIIEGRTMIPVRAIAEAFNKKVTYQDGLIIIGDIDVDTETDADWLTKILERF